MDVSYEDVTNVYIRLYEVVGVFPLETNDSNKFRKRLTIMYFQIVRMIISSMYLTDAVVHFYNNQGEIEYVFENIVIQGICIRFLILNNQRADLSTLMNYCKELWKMLTANEGKIIKHFEVRARYFMIFFMWTTIVGVIFYILSLQLARYRSIRNNIPYERVLPFRFYTEIHEQPWYEIVSIIQDILCFSITPIIMSVETVGPFLIMMTCGYLRSIRNRLLVLAQISHNSDPTTNNNTVQPDRIVKKLALHQVLDCAKFHQKIMEFCKRIEKFMRSLFTIQVMCTAYNVSLVGFRLIQGDSLQYVPVMFMNVLQLFTCQWISQQLLNESKGIADAAYSATLVHREYEAKSNRILLFMMFRAGKPVQMTAGGFIKLSLETFKSMFTSAISFFTVLRSFNN